MKASLITALYRIASSIIVATPIFVNLLQEINIVTSLIYVPVTCLLLTAAFVYFDSYLMKALSKKSEKTSLKNHHIPEVSPFNV